MPRVGHRIVGNEVKSTKYLPLLESFKELTESVKIETGDTINEVASNAVVNEALMNWFIGESADVDGMTASELDDHEDMMREIYENDKFAITNEATSIGTVNPTIGFNVLFHKNLLMNSVYKQGIPNSVALSPKFTETFLTQYLVKPDGTRIDIALEQDKLTAAMNETVPSAEIELALPELATTSIMEKLKGSKIDKLAIDTYISKVKFEVSDEYKAAHSELVSEKDFDEMEEGKTIFKDKTDSKYYMWKSVNLNFVPAAYVQDFDRAVTAKVDFPEAKKVQAGSVQITSDVINANFKSTGEQKMYITSATGLVKAVKLNTKIDTSLATIETCSTDYETKDKVFEIPAGVPLNTTISPDIVKDVKALYNLNHVSLLVEQTMKILDNYKDDTCRTYLDESFVNLNDRYKVTGNFDFEPRQDYALDVVEYRKKSFMDMYESYCTKMLNILNDPDMSFSVFGRPDIIRRITPQEFTYQSPGSIGPVQLDYTKTVYSSNKRVTNFISSRKIKDDKLVIILKPNAGNHRKIYNLYEYCFYMGNEIRNNSNLALPAMHAYERFLMTDYQPVQGRIEILNPTGYKKAEYKGL